MIKLYFHHTANCLKVVLMLEETGLPYELVPIDIFVGHQHQPAYRAINLNGKVPALVDDGVSIADSSAILLYLSEKAGRFAGSAGERGALLSWLMFSATGIGPFFGQAVHFTRIHKDSPYATNRYLREVDRHLAVLDARLEHSPYLAGSSYSIADIAAWPWIDWSDRNHLVLEERTWAQWPRLRRWFEEVGARPAVARARSVGKDLPLKSTWDEEALRVLFPQNFPTPV